MIDGASGRQAPARHRAADDTITKAQLWVETYERPFDPDKIFDIQDYLVVRIVSTCADPFGVIPRSIGDVVRGMDPAYPASFIVLARNPLEDLKATGEIVRSFKQGVEILRP